MLRALIGGVFWLAIASASVFAAEPRERADIREFRVGMAVAELPGEGYVNFACGHDGATAGPAIGGWGDYARCPADADGLHEVAFEYGQAKVRFEMYEGTAVAGFPVIISLLIKDDVVEGIRAVADPAAPRYFRKLAHLLSLKVKARYGPAGWRCVDEPPDEGEAPVGGMFKKERCEKATGERRIKTWSDLYLRAGEPVSAGRFEVWRVAAGLSPEQAAKHPGARLFKTKNCMACHKWHGAGGSGYGSTPVNLRETPLDRDQLAEVVACGRPATGMPFHRKGAYDGNACYGLSRADLGDALPPRAEKFLSEREIKAVADFIAGYFKGHTKVVDADCAIFFGAESKTCQHFRAVGLGD